MAEHLITNPEIAEILERVADLLKVPSTTSDNENLVRVRWTRG